MNFAENPNYEHQFAEVVQIFQEQCALLLSSIVQGEIIPILLHHKSNPDLIKRNSGCIGLLISNVSGVSMEQIEEVIKTIEITTSPDMTASANGMDTTYDLQEYEIDKKIGITGSVVFWYDL